MLSHAAPIAAVNPVCVMPPNARAATNHDAGANLRASQRIADILKLLSTTLAPQRRLVHAGERIDQAGEHFGNLYILNSGFFKIVTASGAERYTREALPGETSGAPGAAGTVQRDP